jgi:autotransporter-associated beta strand protein
MNHRAPLVSIALLFIACAALAAAPSYAATTTWTRGAGTNNWSNNSNWSAGQPTSSVDAIFPNPVPSAVSLIVIDTAGIAASLTFDATYSLDDSSLPGTSLTLGAAGGLVTVNGGTETADLNVMLTGTNGLTKLGAGTLVLHRANGFVGAAGVGEGTLSIGADNQLGHPLNGVVLNGGALNIRNSFSTTRTLTFGNLGSAVDVDLGATFTQLGAIAADNASLTKTGAGKWVLSSASSRIGFAEIQNGTVRLDNAAGLGSGVIIVKSFGLLELPDQISVANTLLLQEDGGLRAASGGPLGPGPAVVTGTCNVSTSAGGAVYLYGGSSASNILQFGNAAPNVYRGGAGATTVVAGPGTVLFKTANDYAGNWLVNSGKLSIANAQALGTGTSAVVVNAGTLDLPNITFNRAITMNDGATLGISEGTYTLAPVSIAPGAATTFALSANNFPAFSMIVGDSANDLTGGDASSTIAVTRTLGVPRLYLQHPSNYAGGWTISSFATVRIEHANALGSGASAIGLVNGGTANGGTLEVFDATLARGVNMFSGSTLRGFGTAAVTGTVAFNGFGAVTLFTDDAADTLTIGDAANDYTSTSVGSPFKTVVAGSGTVALPFANNYAGDWQVDSGTLRVGNAASLGTATSAVVVNGAAALEIAGAALDRPVTLNGTSTLRGTGAAAAAVGVVTVAPGAQVSLASGASASDVLAVGDAANDLTGGSATARISVDGSGKVKLTQPSDYAGTWRLGSGTLEVDADDRLGNAANSVTLAGGTLAFTQTASTARSIFASTGGIAVSAGALVTLNGPYITLAPSNFTKSGAGTLRIAGSQSHDPISTMNIDGGVLELFSPAGTPGGRYLAVNVNSGAALNMNQTQHLRALAVADNARATLDNPTAAAILQTDSFTATGSGKLDLTNEKLIVVSGDVAAIAAKVASGYNGGAWNGPGIVTTTANAGTALGVATAGEVGKTTFGGVDVAPADVLVAFTLAGDADLNATVNFADLVRVAQNYNTTGKSWWQGDFTYDGQVNFADLVKLAQNYNQTLPTAPIPGAPASFESDLGAALAQVPEPGAAWLAGVAASILLKRARRRRAILCARRECGCPSPRIPRARAAA